MEAGSGVRIRTLPDQTVTPLIVFPDKDEFAWRHEQATRIEMHNEDEAIKALNALKHPFEAWPVSPIPGLKNSFSTSWLFLVRLPEGNGNVIFPSVTDRFAVDMMSTIQRDAGIFSLVHLPAARITNPFENIEGLLDPYVKECAAFKVEVPRSWKNKDGQNMELDLMAHFQTVSSMEEIRSIAIRERGCQVINIRWDTCQLTFEAELAALYHLVAEHRLDEQRPADASLRAFEMILDFNSCRWPHWIDLFREFPHLKNPSYVIHGTPKVLVAKFKSLDGHHRAALEGLKEVKNGLYFVNGCPGAGKTEWNMILSALIQSKKAPRCKRPAPILFLVDINKTVDDAANRYQRLCRESGLSLKIIRMHSWPYEMRHSEKLNESHSKQDEENDELDFTKKFMTTACLATYCPSSRDQDTAPTLDEAAWEHYEKQKAGRFEHLERLLRRVDEGDAFSTADWRVLCGQVSSLYRDVLSQADFIATTPAASYGGLNKFFHPKLIFMDEAPHARELTTLIAIAYYNPLLWIFTGDVKQTRPFVKSMPRQRAQCVGSKFNPYSEQLRLSTMARASAAGALNCRLLVNKRAFGNLERLPSRMFYGEQMISGYDEASRFPASTRHLQGYLQSLDRMGGVGELDDNRVVVRLHASKERGLHSSFWNPAHHKWLLEQAQRLLRDENFRSTTGSAGTMMIEAPYSAAVRQYKSEVETWPAEWQDRVEVLTVDRAQGNQADVVFLDMVRTTKPGFMEDPQRLNVAITRARQAEIIVLHQRMTMKYVRGPIRVKTMYLSQILDDAVKNRRFISI
ncbi:nonsense-mediated mRNA decay protein 1 [Drechmeria coniospora]|uniref:Nonsense-mediated mRNA decay protein 1 n=1 Tax=Drechmeria coniospora TaxID=98403 RepID=A0A151GS59_DRECN|nr:nonsense-mediated mRNA decay protein 1 [Drechmeria coniospora]KYK59908.1 nonsense-mediated mRNA decay protein 1 [Drechmeria coniospora]